MATIVTFGEIMARIEPEGYWRLNQVCPGRLKIGFAGAEANVAASIAYLGGSSRFVTALPEHAVAEACICYLRSIGVDTKYILRSKKGRLGLFLMETGANQRPSKVIYDRDSSSVSLMPGNAYPWEEIFAEAHWLHISGITPALSQTAAEASVIAVQQAHRHGLQVSCDLNFRKKLWRWDKTCEPRTLAEQTMRTILNTTVRPSRIG